MRRLTRRVSFVSSNQLTCPLDGVRAPMHTSSKEVFPAPFAPASPTISPGTKDIVTSRTARSAGSRVRGPGYSTVTPVTFKDTGGVKPSPAGQPDRDG